MSADKTRARAGPGPDASKEPANPAAKEPAGPGTRALILAAAAELAKEKGAAHISIEAIAHRAGLSKGGLLYHFPRKDALIHALVEQHMADIDAALADVEASGATRSNAVARAFIELNREKACRPQSGSDGILVALAENPHLLDPIRAHERRIVERIRRTANDRELSFIGLLVIEGMRSLDLFDANQLTAQERADVLHRLLALLGEDGEDGSRTA